MKFDNPRKRTEDGLRKSLLLNYPGCKNVLEALEKVKGVKPEPPSDYQLLKEAILEISEHLGEFDIDFMDRNKRIELYKIPLDSIENVKKWKQGWLNVETK